MLGCKKCSSTSYVKNGFVRQKQRYICKACGCTFVEGDERSKPATEIKQSLCVLLYALGGTTFNGLARILSLSPTTVYDWIREIAEQIEMPIISDDIKEIEFDEMWHFIKKKQENAGLSKHLIVALAKP